MPEDFAFHAVSERPGSLYAASKLAAEFFVQHYADQFGLSVGILRYSAVLGLWAGPNHSVPGRLMAQLLGRGAQQGLVSVTDPLLLWSGGDDFIDARDVALANLAALDAPALPGRVYTIGSGRLTTFADFAQAAQRVRPELRFAPVVLPPTGFAGFAHRRDQPFDVSRARAELDFCARHDVLSSMQHARRFVTD